jgi:hypothetical protein
MVNPSHPYTSNIPVYSVYGVIFTASTIIYYRER